MKIYINGRFLSRKMMGINRFAYEMCKALQKEGVIFEILVSGDIQSCYETSSFKITTIRFLSSHLWEQITLPIYLSSKKDYILINFSGLGPIFNKRQIVTIHDLAFLENPKWYSKTYYLFYKTMTPILAKNAKKILTVSNFSKQEIIKKLKIEEDKIAVIYNAISEGLCSDSKIPSIDDEKFILSVASIDPRKNFTRLLNAYLSSDIKLPLYIIGSKNKVFGNCNILSKSIKNVIFLGYVTDSELKSYYAHAEIFLYPSLYEGFGIPPLEAISNNCPVIASDIPVFREIYKDCICYINPLSEKDIAEKINSLIYNENEKRRLREKGKSLLSIYSWEKSSKKVIETINDCIK